MKSISHNLRRKLFLSALFLVLSTSFASAQVDDADPDVNDEPDVPVDNYIYAGLIAGSFLAIRKLKKSEIA